MSESPKQLSRFGHILFIFGILGGLIGYLGRSMFRQKGLIAGLGYNWMPPFFNYVFWNLGGTFIDFLFQLFSWIIILYPLVSLLEKIKVKNPSIPLVYLYGNFYGGLNFLNGIWRIYFMISLYWNWYEYIF